MVQINFASREINCKIVYYGPGRCGKTTNLQVVHAKAPANSTGELVSIATETDRTLYFDFLPLDLGMIAGMRTKFQLYTVPGQVYYDATRKLVLQGCDGIVFVADSNPDLMAENIESLDNLAKNLAENNKDIMDLPLVLQYNKRDLPNALSVPELNAKLNRNNWETVEAVAVNGDGVFQTLKVISQLVIKKENRQQGYSEDGSSRGSKGYGAAITRPVSAASAPPPPPPPPPPAPMMPVAPPPPPRAAPPPPPAARPAPPPPPAARPAPPPPPAPRPVSQPVARAAPTPPAPHAPPPPQRSAPLPAPPPAPVEAASGKGQEWKSKTDVFRERMAEIRQKQTDDKVEPEKAAASPAAPPVAVEIKPKKKGCFGMLLLFVGLLAAGIAGSVSLIWG